MRLAPILVLLAGVARPLVGQGPGFQLGRLFTDPPGVTYRLDIPAAIVGPVDGGAHAVIIDSRSPLGDMWGAGLDLSLFRGGSAGPYVIGGLEGGVVTGGGNSFWSSWSTGVGYDVYPIRGLTLTFEGRYRKFFSRPDHGIELGVRLGLGGGRAGTQALPPSGTGAAAGGTQPRGALAGEAPAPEAIRADLDSAGVPEDRAGLIGAVVQTAVDVMGMPYRWGGDGAEGFDCSGLIRYAFGRHGVTLPRRSVEQAAEGAAVVPALEALRPGDILTFAVSGDRISHVGLYLGSGRFIHSARGGVQVSRLSEDDVTGRWWFRRWRGARRILS
jgi:cell wall-associated NlpC family hydrolase